MSCALERPEPQALFDRIKNLFSAHVLGGAPIVPESNEHYVVSLDFAMTEEFWAVAEQQWRERDPRYACCDNLIAIAALDGVYLRPAASAQGYVEITGTPGTPLPASLAVAVGEQVYGLSPGATIPASMPAEGKVIARLMAQQPGAAGNNGGIDAGRLISTIAGLDTAVKVCGGAFCGGRDPETCEELRTRYLERRTYRPRATFDWIVETAREWPCLTRLCIRNCDCCEEMHVLQLYAMFDGTFDYGLAPAAVLDDLTDWLFGSPQGFGLGKLEWGAFGKVYPVTAARFDVAIDGLACLKTDQIEIIKTRIGEAVAKLCPSERLCRRAVELIIAQVAGLSCDFQVALEAVDEGLSTEPCGDVVPACDVLPVLRNITILGVGC